MTAGHHGTGQALERGQGWGRPLTGTALLSPSSIWKKSAWGNRGKTPKSRVSPPAAHRGRGRQENVAAARFERRSPTITWTSKSNRTDIRTGEGKAPMPAC